MCVYVSVAACAMAQFYLSFSFQREPFNQSSSFEANLGQLSLPTEFPEKRAVGANGSGKSNLFHGAPLVNISCRSPRTLLALQHLAQHPALQHLAQYLAQHLYLQHIALDHLAQHFAQHLALQHLAQHTAVWSPQDGSTSFV